MVILIGGTGFIGKHIGIGLHKKGIKAISFSRNPDLRFLEEYAPSIIGEKISEFYETSQITNLKTATSLIYLASNSVPSTVNNNVELEYKKNVMPAMRVFDYITNITPTIRIVYLSSGGTVYGSGHCSPIGEGEELNPNTPYAYGKIAIENYLRLLGNLKGLSYSIVRASNPVGRWHSNPEQGFIGAAIARIEAKLPIVIYGTGETVRDYVDADELANAMLRLALNCKASAGLIVNVGSGIGTSLNEIVEVLKVISGVNICVNYKPSRGTDLLYSVLDCNKIQEETGWSAKKGITELVESIWE